MSKKPIATAASEKKPTTTTQGFMDGGNAAMSAPAKVAAPMMRYMAGPAAAAASHQQLAKAGESSDEFLKRALKIAQGLETPFEKLEREKEEQLKILVASGDAQETEYFLQSFRSAISAKAMDESLLSAITKKNYAMMMTLLESDTKQIEWQRKITDNGFQNALQKVTENAKELAVEDVATQPKLIDFRAKSEADIKRLQEQEKKGLEGLKLREAEQKKSEELERKKLEDSEKKLATARKNLNKASNIHEAFDALSELWKIEKSKQPKAQEATAAADQKSDVKKKVKIITKEDLSKCYYIAKERFINLEKENAPRGKTLRKLFDLISEVNESRDENEKFNDAKVKNYQAKLPPASSVKSGTATAATSGKFCTIL